MEKSVRPVISGAARLTKRLGRVGLTVASSRRTTLTGDGKGPVKVVVKHTFHASGEDV